MYTQAPKTTHMDKLTQKVKLNPKAWKVDPPTNKIGDPRMTKRRSSKGWVLS